MAKDFGSSEGCVNDEEIFLRGKQTAEHEYKHFENAFLHFYGLQVLEFEMFIKIFKLQSHMSLER